MTGEHTLGPLLVLGEHIVHELFGREALLLGRADALEVAALVVLEQLQVNTHAGGASAVRSAASKSEAVNFLSRRGNARRAHTARKTYSDGLREG